MLKVKGVNYDIGVPPGSENYLSADKMNEEIRVIKNELHCNAVRIYGRDIDKLFLCAKTAIDHGLMVWLSPRRINSTPEETLQYINECSLAAEELRKSSPQIVYVIGNELSLDIKGFINGDTTYERIKNLSRISSVIINSLGLGFHRKLNNFLSDAVSCARKNYKGEISYASGQWEKINWDNFDIISINYYRNNFNKWIYRRVIRKFARQKKKLAVTEFGCCSYKGAEKKGAWGYSLVDWKQQKPKLKKVCIRDEGVQAQYLMDLLNIYQKENVYAAFVYTFVARKAIYNYNPLYDLDMVNFGLIKVLPSEDHDAGYLWEKKEGFHKIAGLYSSI